VRRYEKKKVLSNPTIHAMHEDGKGVLWIATAGGLNSFAGGTFTAYNVSADREENDLCESSFIQEDREGSLWLATSKGIARFVDGSFERFDRKSGLSDNFVTTILIDKEGSIWVGTVGGLDRFRDEKFVTYSSKVGLSYDAVASVYEDHTGAIWIGTFSGALNRLKDGVITSYDNKVGLPLVLQMPLQRTTKALCGSEPFGGSIRSGTGRSPSFPSDRWNIRYPPRNVSPFGVG